MINNKEYFGTPQTGTTGPFSWSVNTDGTLTITGYTPPQITTIPTTTNPGPTKPSLKVNILPGYILIIPSTLDDKTVTIIGQKSFQGITDFNSVQIPPAVTAIQDSAFDGCTNLQFLGLDPSSSLQTIGNSAFNGTAIRTPTIPASVSSIGDNAFNTTTLYSVNFLGNCPTFTNEAFIGPATIYPDGPNAAALSPGLKTIIFYFDDKKGFGGLDTEKFIPIKVPEVIVPSDATKYNPVWIILIIIILAIALLFGASKIF